MNQFENETTMWTLEKCIKELTDLDQLDEVINIVRKRVKKLSLSNKYSLVVGQKVEVTGTGKFETGKVLKLNRSRAKLEVSVSGTTAIYHVPYSMIRIKTESK